MASPRLLDWFHSILPAAVSNKVEVWDAPQRLSKATPLSSDASCGKHPSTAVALGRQLAFGAIGRGSDSQLDECLASLNSSRGSRARGLRSA
jgi:hypothetical protein